MFKCFYLTEEDGRLLSFRQIKEKEIIKNDINITEITVPVKYGKIGKSIKRKLKKMLNGKEHIYTDCLSLKEFESREKSLLCVYSPAAFKKWVNMSGINLLTETIAFVITNEESTLYEILSAVKNAKIYKGYEGFYEKIIKETGLCALKGENEICERYTVYFTDNVCFYDRFLKKKIIDIEIENNSGLSKSIYSGYLKSVKNKKIMPQISGFVYET